MYKKKACKEWEKTTNLNWVCRILSINNIFDIDIYSRIRGIQDQTKNGLLG